MKRFTFTLLAVFVVVVLMTGVVRLARHQSHKNQAIARAARECGQGLYQATAYVLMDRVTKPDCLEFNLFDGKYKVAHRVWKTHRYSSQWDSVAPGQRILLEYHPEGADPAHPYESESYEAPLIQ